MENDKLSMSSVRKLRQVKRAILAEPHFYDQGMPPLGSEDCNTPCCIFGWICWFHDPKTYGDQSCDRMAEIAGLDYEKFYRLYVDAPGWPMPFRDEYKLARTPAERATVAAARIEHFIATEGRS